MAEGDLKVPVQQQVARFRDRGGITDFLFGSDERVRRIPAVIPTEQSDDKGIGKPFKLTMKRGTQLLSEYTFLINPESANYSFPSRSTVLQTLGGATIDTFGIGVPTITLSGTTGWNVRGNIDGFKAYKALQEFYELYQFEISREQQVIDFTKTFIPFDRISGDVIVEYEDGPSRLTYNVHLQDLKINRTKSRPLLFPFTLVMRVLNIDDRRQRDALVTFDQYAAFFSQGGLRSLLADRSAETKDRLSALEPTRGLLPQAFQAVLDVGNDALETVDNLTSIGEDSIAMIQDSASFITGNIARVAASVRRVARTLQDFSDLPSNIATEFISTINGVIQAFGDIECILQDFTNGRNLRPRIRLISGGDACSTILGAETPDIRPVQGQNTFEELSSAGVPVEILDSVSLSTTALDSLSLIESVDPVLEDYEGIDPVAELANAINGLVIDTDVDYQQSVTEAGLDITNIDVISDIESRTLIQGDSLQSLAHIHLGDSQRWEELAVLNNLRFPYISNEFIETLGPKMADLAIISGAGSTYVFFDVEGASAGQEIYFTDGTEEESHIIQSVDNATNTIVLETSTSIIYTSLAKVSLHEDPTESNTVVLKVGDFILVPTTSVSPTSVNSQETEDTTDLNRFFGLDIKLDTNGFIDLDEDTGDLILTESGRVNISQAVNIRLNTAPEELKHHSDYGIGLPERIGRPATQANASQIILDLKVGIPRDPRIISLKDVEALIENDQTGIRFDAITNGGQTLSNFNFIATR